MDDSRDELEWFNRAKRAGGEPLFRSNGAKRHKIPAAALPPPTRGRKCGELVIRSAADAAAAPHRDYIWKGLVSPGELSMWWGEGGSGKSFLLLYIAYMLALGRDVFGRRVKPVRVLYCGLEGETGVEQRIQALCREYGVAEGFAYIAQPLNLFSDANAVEDLKRAIREQQAGMLFVDTLNRAMGEGSESADADMGRLRGTFDEIRYETGAHVAVVHHGGKDDARGPRGHSGLLFATDLAVKIAADEAGLRTATVTRVKDGRSGAVLSFGLREVELGIDEDGDPITTCIVQEMNASAMLARSGKGGRKLGDEAVSLLRHINDAIAEGRGRVDQPEPGMALYPTISRQILTPYLVERGWLRLSERLSKNGERFECVPDGEHSRLWKRLNALRDAASVGFNRHDVWLAEPAQIP
jgi:hypothetical protein